MSYQRYQGNANAQGEPNETNIPSAPPLSEPEYLECDYLEEGQVRPKNKPKYYQSDLNNEIVLSFSNYVENNDLEGQTIKNTSKYTQSRLNNEIDPPIIEPSIIEPDEYDTMDNVLSLSATFNCLTCFIPLIILCLLTGCDENIEKEFLKSMAILCKKMYYFFKCIFIIILSLAGILFFSLPEWVIVNKVVFNPKMNQMEQEQACCQYNTNITNITYTNINNTNISYVPIISNQEIQNCIETNFKNCDKTEYTKNNDLNQLKGLDNFLGNVIQWIIGSILFIFQIGLLGYFVSLCFNPVLAENFMNKVNGLIKSAIHFCCNND